MSDIKVWRQFEVRKDGSTLKLRIQDAQPEQKQDVLEFMKKYFLREETLQKASGIHKNEEAVEEYGAFWEHIMADCHTVVCCPDRDTGGGAGGGGGPIVGLSMLTLETKDKKRNLDEIVAQAKTPEVKKLLEVVRVAAEWCDGFRELAVHKYYAGRGLTVHPAYRKLGIARRLVSNRRQICREHKVPATGALMTAAGTQMAAASDGWRVLKEVPFDELGRMCGVVFDGPPICKYMVAEENV